MRIRRRIPQENSHLQMSAMIDIVFLLLVFFVMTFKITAVEGDFFIRSQQQEQGAPAMIDMELPIRLHVAADADGEIKGIHLNNMTVADLDALQDELRHIGHQFTRVANSKSQLVILECDSQLRYECTIEILTAVKQSEIDSVGFDIRFQSS